MEAPINKIAVPTNRFSVQQFNLLVLQSPKTVTFSKAFLAKTVTASGTFAGNYNNRQSTNNLKSVTVF